MLSCLTTLEGKGVVLAYSLFTDIGNQMNDSSLRACVSMLEIM